MSKDSVGDRMGWPGGDFSLANQVSVLMMQNQQLRSFSAEMGTPLFNKMKTTAIVLLVFLGGKQSDCSKKVSRLGEHCSLCSESLYESLRDLEQCCLVELSFFINLFY